MKRRLPNEKYGVTPHQPRLVHVQHCKPCRLQPGPDMYDQSILDDFLAQLDSKQPQEHLSVVDWKDDVAESDLSSLQDQVPGEDLSSSEDDDFWSDNDDPNEYPGGLDGGGSQRNPSSGTEMNMDPGEAQEDPSQGDPDEDLHDQFMGEPPDVQWLQDALNGPGQNEAQDDPPGQGPLLEQALEDMMHPDPDIREEAEKEVDALLNQASPPAPQAPGQEATALQGGANQTPRAYFTPKHVLHISPPGASASPMRIYTRGRLPGPSFGRVSPTLVDEWAQGHQPQVVFEGSSTRPKRESKKPDIYSPSKMEEEQKARYAAERSRRSSMKKPPETKDEEEEEW